MPVKTILFLLGFVVASAGALGAPVIGIIGYMMHYMIGPERQWWALPLQSLGLRYSYTLALASAIGIIFGWHRLRHGKTILRAQEVLILMFLGMMWLTLLYADKTMEKYVTTDHPTMKMAKVVVFVLMMTHVVTTLKHFRAMMWTLVFGAMVLGLQAWQTPYDSFAQGRLESVGGADFSDANAMGAFVGAMLPIIGVQFLLSGRKGKLICMVAGAFAANAVVLTRSRGATVGILAGVALAGLLAPKERRKAVFAGLCAAAVGACFIVDPGFIARAKTIQEPSEGVDGAITSRLHIWDASLRMWRDNPGGVGVGNFFQKIGRYDSRYADRDAHSTYFRCATELGIGGVIIFFALLGGFVISLVRTARAARALPPPAANQLRLYCFAVGISMTMLLFSGMTMTLIYIEGIWWLMAMPACLARSVENEMESHLIHGHQLPRRQPAGAHG